jgi:hypothetical protein
VIRFNGGSDGLDNGASDVAIQGDGKIVVVGQFVQESAFSDPELSLLRFNPDGTLDRSFGGQGTGFVLTDFGRGRNDRVSSIIPRYNGDRLTVAGSSNRNFALARNTNDRVPDTVGLAEAVALAVHFEDVAAVREPAQQQRVGRADPLGVGRADPEPGNRRGRLRVPNRGRGKADLRRQRGRPQLPSRLRLRWRRASHLRPDRRRRRAGCRAWTPSPRSSSPRRRSAPTRRELPGRTSAPRSTRPAPSTTRDVGRRHRRRADPVREGRSAVSRRPRRQARPCRLGPGFDFAGLPNVTDLRGGVSPIKRKGREGTSGCAARSPRAPAAPRTA